MPLVTRLLFDFLNIWLDIFSKLEELTWFLATGGYEVGVTRIGLTIQINSQSEEHRP